MTNRREFLQTAAALSAAAPLAGRAAFSGSQAPVALDAVVVDTRHADARAFAGVAEVLGAPLRFIEGDITDLWQNELRKRWQAGTRAVAGLTERPALFLLERLAWDHGMRVVFEAEHMPAEGGSAAHRVLRSADPQLSDKLAAAGNRWTRVLAHALVASGGAATRDFRPTSAALAAHLGEATKLHSWIIAPRNAV